MSEELKGQLAVVTGAARGIDEALSKQLASMGATTASPTPSPKILPLIEANLTPFNPRPHWAKLSTYEGAHLRQVYPKLADFKSLVQHYDPNGKFRNDLITAELFSA